MLLGNTSWRIRRIESNSGRLLVEDAHGAPPNIPFWRGEAPARTDELSHHVAELRERVSALLPNTVPLAVPNNPEAGVGEGAATKARLRGIESSPEVQNAVAWLKDECGLDDSGAEQLIEYIVTGRAVLTEVPTQDCIIA